MADVGRSTAAHAEGDLQSHATIERLRNWGAWQRALPEDGPGMYPPQPMFREVVDRYRETFALDPYDPVDAELMEHRVAKSVSIKYGLCLKMYFILQLSSRKSAGLLSRMGYPCSHTAYRAWVDDAINKLSIHA